MVQKFEVELLEKAFDFLEKLDTKAKNKIFQNLERAKYETTPQLFKKLEGEIWEFRTLFFGKQYRLLAPSGLRFYLRPKNKKSVSLE